MLAVERAHLLVANHLGAALAVVKSVGDADHASRAEVVGGGSFNGARTAHAPENLDRGNRSLDGVHAVSVARGVSSRGRGCGGDVGVGRG
jgi:hypothetical protein